MTTKYCKWCRNMIRPKPLPRGGIESPSQVSARKFCSRHCWREWLADNATGRYAARLIREQRQKIEARQFVPGQLVWYTRHFTESFGWPVSVPAEFVRYLDDFGRSRVVIVVFDRDGRQHSVWTTERKLSRRAELMAFEKAVA